MRGEENKRGGREESKGGQQRGDEWSEEVWRRMEETAAGGRKGA